MAVENIEVGKTYRRPPRYVGAPGDQIEVLFVGAERALFRHTTTGHEASITLHNARRYWSEIDQLPACIERERNGYVYKKDTQDHVYVSGVGPRGTVYMKTGPATIGAIIPFATLEWLVARVKQDADA